MRLIQRLLILSLLGVVFSGLVLAGPARLSEAVLAQTPAPVLVGAGDITACDQVQDARLLLGASKKCETCGTDFSLELFKKGQLQDLSFPGTEIPCFLNPMFGFIIHSKSSFSFGASNQEKVIT